jgi:type II secretory pathway component GspD/PulD (secretin)
MKIQLARPAARLLAVAALLLGQTLSAQDDPGAADAPRAGTEDLIAVEPDAVSSAAGSGGAGGTELISITLDDVPLVDVVRMFTRISGVNIIASAEDLQGNVTVNLNDVSWKPALGSILAMHNLALVEKEPGSSVYSVVPRAPDAPPPMVTRSFTLHFSTVSDVAPVVESMLSEGGTLSAFGSRNIIVVRSTSENLAEIQDLIDDIDIPTKQVCIETKFMELTDAASKKLGINWSSLDEFGVKARLGPFSRTEDTTATKTRTDALSRFDTRQNTDTVQNFYDLDNQPYETLEDLEIIERPDGTYEELATLVPTREVTDTIDLGQNVTMDIVEDFTKTIVESQSAIMEMDAFELVLSALKTTDGVTIISNPKMIVANGSTNAFFSVGEQEPIIKQEVTRGTAESPGDKVSSELDVSINTDNIQDGYLRTGIDLRVVPVVKTDDLIEASIRPKLVRRLLPDKTVGDNSWPRISVKEIFTQFTLRSGQTVAIGGLTGASEDKKVSKIPLLGDLPLVGKYLFSHTADVHEQTETIIFVTLSLAMPELLYEDAGIPGQSQLVHKERIEKQQQREQFQIELEQIEDAARRESEARSRRAKSDLLKRR